MRRHDSSAFVNQVLVYALVAICAAGSLGLGTVWLRHQISLAANANKALQAKIAEVQRHIEEMSVEVAAEQDPAVLSRRNQEWHLGLAAPPDAQVMRIAVDPVLRLAALHNRSLFGERPMISFLGSTQTEAVSGRRPATASVAPPAPPRLRFALAR
jgi:hypothetical protein